MASRSPFPPGLITPDLTKLKKKIVLITVAWRTVQTWCTATVCGVVASLLSQLFHPWDWSWWDAAASGLTGLLMITVLHTIAGYKFFSKRRAATKFRMPTKDELGEMNEAPRNVRVKWSTGEITPLELIPIGKDEEGIKHWMTKDPVRPPLGANPGEVEIEADYMPAQTSVGMMLDPRPRQ